ncbi:MAG: hypothetical protein WC547_10075, partial [Candidatus Omnitrophota bacterium]
FVPIIRHQVKLLKIHTSSKEQWLPRATLLQKIFADMDIQDLFDKLVTQGKDLETMLGSSVHEWAVKIQIAHPDPIGQSPNCHGGLKGSELDLLLTDLARRLKAVANELYVTSAPKIAKIDKLVEGEIGILHFYHRRIFGPLFAREFWGITKRMKPIAIITNLLLIGLGIILIPYSLALGTWLIAASIFMTPVCFGYASSAKERAMWLLIMFGSSAYTFGLMSHHLYWKSSLIDPQDFAISIATLLVTAAMLLRIGRAKQVSTLRNAVMLAATLTVMAALYHYAGPVVLSAFGIAGLLFGKTAPTAPTGGQKLRASLAVSGLSVAAATLAGDYGLHFTLILHALTVIPTLISFYHLIVASRSHIELQNEVWSDTARSLVGPRSFIRFVSINTPILFGLFYAKWYKEIKNTESRHMRLTPNGEPVNIYLSNQIRKLLVPYLSQKEMESWLKALRGERGGRFVRPRSPKARKIIWWMFFALSQKKPVTDVYAVLKPNSTHVQAWRELHTYTFENSMLLGTFHANPKTGAQSTLVGYMARMHRPEWNNTIDFLLGKLGHKSQLEALRAITEWDDVREILFARTNSLNIGQIKIVIDGLVQFLNEMRPSDQAVVASMAEDFVEHHLYVSHQLGDFAYHRAVEAVRLQYPSLQEAFDALKVKAGRNKQEEEFVKKYPRFQKLVDIKLRQIFEDAALWDENVTVGNDGNTIWEFPPLGGGNEAYGLPGLFKRLEVFISNPATSSQDRTMAEAILKAAPFEDYRTRIAAGTLVLSREKYSGSSTDVKTIAQWSEEFLAWRLRHLEMITDFFSRQREGKLLKAWELMTAQLAPMALQCARSNVTAMYCAVPWVEETMFYDKNAYISGDAWMAYGRQVNYDAHVRAYPGQTVWRTAYSSWHGRNPHLAVISPAMVIWASSTNAFPVTKDYNISQETWTSDVQRGRRNMLTGYGKECAILPASCSVFSPPGEDSGSFLMLQRSQPLYTSTQMDWFTWEWGRPSLLGESLAGTEMRYAYNVTCFLSDRGQFELFYNENLPFDKKLSHLFLWFHYIITPFALALMLLLSPLAPF